MSLKPEDKTYLYYVFCSKNFTELTCAVLLLWGCVRRSARAVTVNERTIYGWIRQTNAVCSSRHVSQKFLGIYIWSGNVLCNFSCQTRRGEAFNGSCDMGIGGRNEKDLGKEKEKIWSWQWELGHREQPVEDSGIFSLLPSLSGGWIWVF